jgi:hypothetical protein
MKDKPDFSIEIQIKDEDINVFSISSKEFTLTAKNRSLLLIALHQLKEKILNKKLEDIKC